MRLQMRLLGLALILAGGILGLLRGTSLPQPSLLPAIGPPPREYQESNLLPSTKPRRDPVDLGPLFGISEAPAGSSQDLYIRRDGGSLRFEGLVTREGEGPLALIRHGGEVHLLRPGDVFLGGEVREVTVEYLRIRLKEDASKTG